MVVIFYDPISKYTDLFVDNREFFFISIFLRLLLYPLLKVIPSELRISYQKLDSSCAAYVTIRSIGHSIGVSEGDRRMDGQKDRPPHGIARQQWLLTDVCTDEVTAVDYSKSAVESKLTKSELEVETDALDSDWRQSGE